MRELKHMGVGANVRRNEDRRHLRGRGEFVADLSLPGMREVVFVRSEVPHGRIVGIEQAKGTASGAMWTAENLDAHVKPIVGMSGRPGFRPSDYPILATTKVRFVGEPVAMVVADDRASAEDLAEP